MADAPPPPPEVARFVELIGVDLTLKLLEEFGGIRVRMGAGGGARNRLVQTLGEDAARALAREFLGDMVRVPMAKWWRARIYADQGMSYRAIARALGCNDTTVWSYLRGRNTDARQIALPL